MPPDAEGLKPRKPERKTPKLRTREQLTVRYKQTQEELVFWKEAKHHTNLPSILLAIDNQIARCEERLNTLEFAMNGVV